MSYSRVSSARLKFRGLVAQAAQAARAEGLGAEAIVTDLRDLAGHLDRIGTLEALDPSRPPTAAEITSAPSCRDCGIVIRQVREDGDGDLIWVTVGQPPRAFCGLSEDALHHPTS